MTTALRNSEPEKRQIPPGEAPRASILVVDDERLNREMLAAVLGARQFSVITASSGRDAIERLIDEPVDLVLLDVVMPDADGLEILQQIRELQDPVELPVIMCTSNSDSDQVVEAFSLGANDYITKPFDVDVALARIKTHLDLKRAQSALRESEERYALVARGTNDGLWDWNLATGAVYYSPRWKQMMGCDEAEVDGSPDAWFGRIHADDRERVREELVGGASHARSTYELEFRMRHRDGDYRWILCRGLAVRDRMGRATRIAGSITDITHAKVSDALTGLPNRILFLDRLDQCIRRARNHDGLPYAVLFLDLDNFKLINDSLGHEAGDLLLSELADRLVECVRLTDLLASANNINSVARLGGDEFTILLEGLTQPQDAEMLAQRILSALAEPFVLCGHEVHASASIGIALGANRDCRADDMLREADTAMYHAKARGRSRYCVFDVSMQERAAARLALEQDLRRALERDEFILRYQPIYSLETERIVGVEALVRWDHPTRGIVGPADFISVAEETGMIVPIGRRVVRTACEQAAAWQRRHPHDPALLLTVNVSCKQLADAGLVDLIRTIIIETGIDPRSLKLEVTESTLMENPAKASAILSQLRAMSVQIGLDDFGTGYSCLAMLRRLPLDVLKVDRSFIQDMTSRSDDAAIVKTVLSLAKNLGLDAIAEGVETEEQAKLLAAMGCRWVQGYFYSRPVGAERIEELLAANA